MYLLGVDGGERVVEGLDDVVSVPRAGDNRGQSCRRVKTVNTETVTNPGISK